LNSAKIRALFSPDQARELLNCTESTDRIINSHRFRSRRRL